MKGFKYIYKRGKLWRTWREVEDESLKKKKILIYRAENNEDRTCAECHNRGYWALEVEPVQCPYEIFSMKNANNVCVTDVKHFAKGKQCTKYTRLKTLKNNCNNPIITKWRFTKTYDILERNLPESSAICQGREKCEVTTIYQFQPHQIIFRVVDEKNLIIYSRVMRKNEKNFACVDNCGYFDIDNMLVQKTPVTISKKLNAVKDHHTYEQSTCNSPNEETTQKLQFIEEQPIINWKSHEFKFNNTVNQRYVSATKQASEPVTNDNKEIPIARSGRRVSINSDINNNFLDDITKVDCTTKLQCRNIIKDGDCYDDDSGNAYYNDDEEKEINIDNY
ncbi:uncharacterized protein LOC113234543 [Hyposmocoma kahamanoa]|uniref:uncharacterized protein LOC113234543 n=1 Tax=Hyposmocoma kahamanoa TaxID=1477025 RepID=UPI000E6D7FD0|nr:uncharacterized protein LOC113234543 [Hyposmocoma kahamanoa]